MSDKFQGEGDSQDGGLYDKAAMEIRAMALVLSGFIPPYIQLEQVIGEAEKLLEDTAGLLPQKALMTG